MIESGLITPNGEKIIIPYYEVGSYLRKIIDNYISLNDTNKKLFDDFKKDYKRFDPDIDFCLCVLGYKLYNPFLFDNKIIEGNGNYLADSDNKNIVYKKSTNLDLKIDNVSSDNLKDCVIDSYGTKFEIDRENSFHHEQLFELLLMQYMKDDKQLYDDYIDCRENKSEFFPTINSYFRNKLGFLQVVVYEDNSGYVLYNQALLSEYKENLLSSIKDFYPKIQFEPDYIDLEYKKNR